MNPMSVRNRDEDVPRNMRFGVYERPVTCSTDKLTRSTNDNPCGTNALFTPPPRQFRTPPTRPPTTTMPPSASDSDSDSEPFFILPEEPASYRAASPEPTCKPHTLSTAPHEQLQIHFVGNDPLWGHMLWNAGVVMSQYLEAHAADLFQGRTVLELGAGGGLPSLTCGLRGAKQVRRWRREG